jgi:hypothetical protein
MLTISKDSTISNIIFNLKWGVKGEHAYMNGSCLIYSGSSIRDRIDFMNTDSTTGEKNRRREEEKKKARII